MKKKKLILILSGDGAKGAFQVGAYNRMLQDGLQFENTHLEVNVPDAVFGISTGAFNGACIAMGKFRELLKFWNQIAGNPNQIYMGQFLKSEVLKEGFVSLKDGKYHSLRQQEFPKDQELQKAVLASESIPMIWTPLKSVKTNDFELNQLNNGEIRDTTPFRNAIKYVNSSEDDAEYHFLVICCHTPALDVMEIKPNPFSIAESTLFDISMNEIQDSDLTEFLRINDLVKQAAQKGVELFSKNGRTLKSFNVRIIRPERKLKGCFDFSRSAIMDSFAHGYQVAQKATKP